MFWSFSLPINVFFDPNGSVVIETFALIKLRFNWMVAMVVVVRGGSGKRIILQIKLNK